MVEQFSPFRSDAEILAELQKPFSLAYVASRLKVPMARVLSVRDAYKTAIVEARLEKGQSIAGICLHLDIVSKYEQMKEWASKHKRTETTNEIPSQSKQ